MSRTVTINIDGEQFIDIHRHAPDTLAAIGYLATWALASLQGEDSVTISAYVDDDMYEMLAVYRNASSRDVVMGAIYRRKAAYPKWEFHT